MRPIVIPSKLSLLKSYSIRTTLFDLIYARQAEVEPGEEGFITDEVSCLLEAGRITCCDDPESWAELSAETTSWEQEDELGYPQDHFEPGTLPFKTAAAHHHTLHLKAQGQDGSSGAIVDGN